MVRELLERPSVKAPDKLKVVLLYALRYENKASQLEQFRGILETQGLVAREDLSLISLMLR
jgi:hypothetical protein